LFCRFNVNADLIHHLWYQGKSAARFSCSKCRLNGIRVRVSWEATLVVDDGTDEAKLSVDDEQLLQVLQMPVSSSTSLYHFLHAQFVNMTNMCFAFSRRG